MMVNGWCSISYTFNKCQQEKINSFKAVSKPQDTANRLKDYKKRKKIASHERIFPLKYGSTRNVVNKAGKLPGNT